MREPPPLTSNPPSRLPPPLSLLPLVIRLIGVSADRPRRRRPGCRGEVELGARPLGSDTVWRGGHRIKRENDFLHHSESAAFDFSFLSMLLLCKKKRRNFYLIFEGFFQERDKRSQWHQRVQVTHTRTHARRSFKGSQGRRAAGPQGRRRHRRQLLRRSPNGQGERGRRGGRARHLGKPRTPAEITFPAGTRLTRGPRLSAADG